MSRQALGGGTTSWGYRAGSLFSSSILGSFLQLGGQTLGEAGVVVQGICVPGCCTICPSGRAWANARVYWRVRGEEPCFNAGSGAFR
jgi:hypothetical protein